MFEPQTYNGRRNKLINNVQNGLILFPGNQYLGINGPHNFYPFRQDSSFLYYFGIDKAGYSALIDTDSGESILFADDAGMDDIVWTGPQISVQERAEMAGVRKVQQSSELAEILNQAGERSVHFLPQYQHANLIRISSWLGLSIREVRNGWSEELVRAVVAQREIKTPDEINEINRAADITCDMHLAAMKSVKAGLRESEVMAEMLAVVNREECLPSFRPIVSVRGEILHNETYSNEINAGSLLLVDCGSEAPSHYAGDMTRTYPVNGRFSQKQKEVYQVVLNAQKKAVNLLRPGVKYRDVHLSAAKVIFEGLKDLGLTRSDTDEAVQAGAHALFFPHGLGHQMGLDVHDMEDLGEDFVGYDDQVQRSQQFGLAFLRLGKELKKGMVLTVEPGIYFIPELFHAWKEEGRHKEFLNYDKIEAFLDFGGIRIEDDYHITDDSAELLGKGVPKEIKDIDG